MAGNVFFGKKDNSWCRDVDSAAANASAISGHVIKSRKRREAEAGRRERENLRLRSEREQGRGNEKSYKLGNECAERKIIKKKRIKEREFTGN